MNLLYLAEINWEIPLKLKSLACILLVLLRIQSISAHDFESAGIYYTILSEEDDNVEMSGLCQSTDSSKSDTFTLPPYVTNNGKTYTVVAIGKGAMQHTNFKSFSMPETLIEIKDSAFYYSGCYNLRLPDSVRRIGKLAFNGSNYVYSKLPESLEEIGQYAFCMCSVLDSIEIPKSVKKIGDYAFVCCESLKSVKLPDTIDHIGKGWFCECESLKEINLSNNITEIGDDAFRGCQWLAKLELPETIRRIGDYAFAGCIALKISKLPDSLEYIGDSAFISITFESLSIPKKVNTIAEGAFGNVFQSFSVESGNKYYKAYDDCLYSISMDTLMFVPKNKLGLRVPEGVRRIGARAFLRNRETGTVFLPQSVKELGRGAFQESHITYIDLPDSIETLTQEAFLDTSLEDIKLPRNLRSIEYLALYLFDGISMKKLVLPEKLDTIGWVAINIYADSVISLNPTPPRVHRYGLVSGYQKNKLIVPVGSAELYANALEWRDFKYIVEEDFSSVAFPEADNIQIEINGGIIRISGKEEDLLFTIHDLSGRVVFSGNTSEISGLPSGLYILRIGTISKKIFI